MDTLLYVGVTNFYTAPNGIWYQEAFPHKIKSVSPSLFVEIVKDKGDLTYGFNYMYVGTATSRALAVGKDSNYNLATNQCNGKCLPLVQFNGVGSVNSIGVFVRRNFQPYYIDFGINLMRPTWKMDMPDWTDGDQERYHLHVEHNPKLQVMPSLSFGYRNIKLSFIPTVAHGDEWPAIYRGVSTNISVGYKF